MAGKVEEVVDGVESVLEVLRLLETMVASRLDLMDWLDYNYDYD